MDPVINQTYAVQSPQKSSFMDNFGSMSLKKKGMGILGIALMIVVIGFLWTWVTSPMIITVNGVGEVSATAQAATISFTYVAYDAKPDKAVETVTNSAAAIKQILKVYGVQSVDIAESQVTVVPSSTASQTGYQASIILAAKTSQVADANKLVSALYLNGAALVSQPVLSIENKDALEKEALDAAIKDAKKQANALALRNLKPIRKIISMTQASSSSTSTATSGSDDATIALNPEAATSGVFKIVKAVSISYKMW